jgi:hypothetical protein
MSAAPTAAAAVVVLVLVLVLVAVVSDPTTAIDITPQPRLAPWAESTGAGCRVAGHA